MKKLAWIIFAFILFPVFSAHAAVNNIVVSEVLSDPTDTVDEKEFIEIKNTGDEEIDLSGFYTDDIDGGSSPRVIANGTKIEPGGYLVFYMKGILNNSGDSARLLRSDKSLVTEVTFGASLSKDTSYSRKVDSSYEWTTQNTPGEENVFNVPSPTPSPTPTATPTPTSTPTSPSTSSPSATPTPDYSAAKSVIVNEALPDPAGNDGENEFIEIRNTSGQAIDLSNFFIDDAEGGSSAYKIPESTTIEANGYLVFYSRDTKISLNNSSGDSARILYPDKSLLVEMVFGKSPKADNSYARKTDGSYAWTAEPTPGEENNFVDSDYDSTPTPTPKASTTASLKSTVSPKPKVLSDEIAPQISATSTTRYVQKREGLTTLSQTEEITETRIEDIRQIAPGTKVMVRGVVSQSPGIFDQQLMYLAGSGVGIYLAQGVFPELVTGDVVAVTGILAKPNKEFFIVAAKPEDIVKNSVGDIPTPHKIKISEITEENIGWLVSTEGEITQKEKDHLTLKDGDKIMEILLAKEVDAKVGERVIVTGIVSASGENLRILASDVEPESGKSLAIQQNIKNSIISRWREVASVFCFCCAAVLFVYLKMGPRKGKDFIETIKENRTTPA